MKQNRRPMIIPHAPAAFYNKFYNNNYNDHTYNYVTNFVQIVQLLFE